MVHFYLSRYCFEIATFLGTMEYFFVQQGEELKNAGLDSFVRNLKGTPAKLVYTLSNLLFLLAIPARFLQWADETEDDYRVLEEKLLAIAIPGFWFYLMFFAG